MGEMATSSHMQSINRSCLLRPARQEAELREAPVGMPPQAGEQACWLGVGTQEGISVVW